jgi:hypothetical protein|nr:MAG TPA: hypothetical protein [Caudoviricetes sp.]
MKNDKSFTDKQIREFVEYKLQDKHKQEIRMILVTKVDFENNIYTITYNYIIEGFNYFLYGQCKATTEQIEEVLEKAEKSKNKHAEIELEYLKALTGKDLNL